MICPNCKFDTLNEEKDMVVCSYCGLKSSLQEYNAWKKIYEVKPRRREKTVFRENEDNEVSTGTFAGKENQSMAVIIGVLFLVILLILIASIL